MAKAEQHATRRGLQLGHPVPTPSPRVSANRRPGRTRLTARGDRARAAPPQRRASHPHRWLQGVWSGRRGTRPSRLRRSAGTRARHLECRSQRLRSDQTTAHDAADHQCRDRMRHPARGPTGEPAPLRGRCQRVGWSAGCLDRQRCARPRPGTGSRPRIRATTEYHCASPFPIVSIEFSAETESCRCAFVLIIVHVERLGR